MKKKFLECSKFIVYVCKILGATLHSFENGNTAYSKIKKYIWCIPMWILYVACVIYTFINRNDVNAVRPLIVEQFANIATLTNSLLQFPIVFAFTVKNAVASKQLMQELDVINCNLKNSIKIRNSNMNYFILTIATIFILIDYVLKFSFYNMKFVLLFGSFIFGYVVSIYESLLIAVVVIEIKRQFAVINLRLENLALCMISHNNFIPEWKQNFIASSTKNDIKELMEYHSQLLNVAHKTYRIYQPAVLRSIISYFAFTCFSIFEGITYIIAYYQTGELRRIFTFITICKGTLLVMIMMWFVIRTWISLSGEVSKHIIKLVT